MRSRHRAALAFGLWLLLLATPFAVAAGEVRPFVAGSYQKILASESDRPLIVVFWSLDCAHCLEELPQLGGWASRHRVVRLVLVSTDAPENTAVIATTLQAQGLAGHDAWVFADEPPERLRHEIDPRWRGELPRHTLRARDGARRAILGRLDPAELDRWLADQSTGR